MERFEVLSVAGEGSFGRVYKARRKENNEIVAFKVIQKRGRSERELEGLRQECEIQRQLHHPNIIHMLESFETDNEIVVVSEFADRQLYELLGKTGYLPEPRVLQITCDLVAALYYLHSNRVLHRDLKPQNVLLSSDGTAKLCDFGFARSMSCNTMLLTSIKGTPLYMAPELVTESPYDHNADLWSLGCIVYELLVGRPPFSTTSILALVHLIRHEPIRFPDFVSPDCVSFLQGLLQKESSKRLTWPELLQHPFLQGKVVVPKDQVMSLPPLTDPLSDSQQKVKENQRLRLVDQLSVQTKQTSQTIRLLEEYEKRQHRRHALRVTDEPPTPLEPLAGASGTLLSPNKTPTPCVLNDLQCSKRRTTCEWRNERPSSCEDSDDSSLDTPIKQSQEEWQDPNPSQNEEWLDYLQRSMEEVMSGDLSCLLKPPLVAVATAPLSRKNASPRVIEYVACLLSIPFVVEDITSDQIATLFDTYLESNLVDQILQGARTLVTNRTTGQLIPARQLHADQLHALDRMCLLLSHLVHRQPPQLAAGFTRQLHAGLQRAGGTELVHQLLTVAKRKARVVANMLAVLAQLARLALDGTPQLLHQVMFEGEIPIELSSLLGHSNELVRSRSCVLLTLLSSSCPQSLAAVWSPLLSERLHTLAQDENYPRVQQAAMDSISQLSQLPFFSRSPHTTQ